MNAPTSEPNDEIRSIWHVYDRMFPLLGELPPHLMPIVLGLLLTTVVKTFEMMSDLAVEQHLTETHSWRTLGGVEGFLRTFVDQTREMIQRLSTDGDHHMPERQQLH